MSQLNFEEAKNKKVKEKHQIFPSQPKIKLQVGNEIVNSEVLSQNISGEIFHGNLQESVKKSLEAGLMSLVG